MNRRSFLAKTGSAGAAGLLVGLPGAQDQAGRFPLPPGSRLVILAPYWGFNGTMDAFCAAAKKDGYQGIEALWPVQADGQQEVLTAVKKYGLELGLLCRAEDLTAATHLVNFKKNIESALVNTVQKPLYINCHTGRDFFTMEEGLPFLDAGIALQKKYGVPIWHETHRTRLFYSAPVTRQYLMKQTGFLLNADLSHWCAVHESLLEDQEETMRMVLDRCGHIHARIGHPEGPQVNDPRAPEWKATVDRHLAWWDEVIKNKLRRGENTITILTEFGPPAYMPTLPYTRQPVADQWEVNVYMMKLLRDRYAHLS